MANPWRGDVPLIIDGHQHVLRLTLGALAELETNLGENTLLGLVERFESGNFSSKDVLVLLAAWLLGGRCDVSADTLAHAQIEGGPMGAAKAAAELLARAFMAPAV